MSKFVIGFVTVACAATLSAFGQNKVVFDNQSGDPALVRLIGPTKTEVQVPSGAKQGVDAAAGKYTIKVRYGTPGSYRYSKGQEFEVTETATARSETTITLHKVVAGNYDAHPISEAEFGTTAEPHTRAQNRPTTTPAEATSAVGTNALSIPSDLIGSTMSTAYANLDKKDLWRVPWETTFDKDRHVPVVKALLERSSDVRWARILLDPRIIGPNQEEYYNWIAGSLMRLSGEFQARPLDKPFEYVPVDATVRSKLLGTVATRKTIEDIYGKPTRVDAVRMGDKDLDLILYGIIGFYTDSGTSEIKGVYLPYVFVKLGFRDFATLVLKAAGEPHEDTKKRPTTPPTVQ